MASYVLRKIDSELWQRVRSRAADEGINVKDLIEQLLVTWLSSPRSSPGPSSPSLHRVFGHQFIASYGNRDYCGVCGESKSAHRPR